MRDFETIQEFVSEHHRTKRTNSSLNNFSADKYTCANVCCFSAPSHLTEMIVPEARSIFFSLVEWWVFPVYQCWWRFVKELLSQISEHELRFGKFEIMNDDLNFFAVHGCFALKSPQVDMERSSHSWHGGIERWRCSVGEKHVLTWCIGETILTLKWDIWGSPSESMCRVGALQRDQLARCHVLSRSQCTRIDSKEQVRCCRFRSTPFGYFNVDLIGSIDTTVGEETKHDIRIEFIDRTFDKPLICTETEFDIGVQFGTCPSESAGRATKCKMKLVILIQPNIARSPVVWSCSKSKATTLSSGFAENKCPTNQVHCSCRPEGTIDILPIESISEHPPYRLPMKETPWRHLSRNETLLPETARRSAAT